MKKSTPKLPTAKSKAPNMPKSAVMNMPKGKKMAMKSKKAC